MPRKPTDDEHSLWRQVTQEVAPLKKREKNVPPTKQTPPAERPRTRHKFVAEDMKLPPEEGIDRKQQRRLRRGDHEIDATLDLHGLTQDRAYDVLVRFLEGAMERGNRIVLVVTGKGKGDAPGVLRAALPQWITKTELSRVVMRIAPALPQHGGNGAYYVFLRKRKLG